MSSDVVVSAPVQGLDAHGRHRRHNRRDNRREDNENNETKDGATKAGTAEKMFRSGTTKAKKTALKRLAKDLRLCFEEFIPGVSACPISSDNLMEWHGNIKGLGPYAGLVFHFKINLDDDYPTGAPRVKILTTLIHPFVFGKWICLDILEKDWCPGGTWLDSKGKKLDGWRQGATYVTDKRDKYSGWSTAYTIATVLLQLQGFLMDEDIMRRQGYSTRSHVTESQFKSKVNAARSSCQTFKCSCGHKPTQIWPPFRDSAVPKNDDPAIAEALRIMLLQAHTQENFPGHVLCPAFTEISKKDKSTSTSAPSFVVGEIIAVETGNSNAEAETKSNNCNVDKSAKAATKSNSNAEVETKNKNCKRIKAATKSNSVIHLQRGDSIKVLVKDCLPNRRAVAFAIDETNTSTFYFSKEVVWKNNGTDYSIEIPVNTGDVLTAYVKHINSNNEIQLSISPVKPLNKNDQKQISRHKRNNNKIQISDLRPGLKLNGTVVNVKHYGVFVKIHGLQNQDGLIHISRLNRRLFTGDNITVFVVDYSRGRLSLDLNRSTTTTTHKRTALEQITDSNKRKGIVKAVVNGLGIFVDCGAVVDAFCAASQVRQYLKCWELSSAIKKGEEVCVHLFKVKQGGTKLSATLVSALGSKNVETDQNKITAATMDTVGTKRTIKKSVLEELPDHLLRQVANFLFTRGSDDIAFSLTCHRFHDYHQTHIVSWRIRNELTCFFSKRTVDEDVLGYGIALEHYPSRHNDDVPRIAYAHVSLDLLSLTSYGQEKVRESAFKEKFTHWMPLVIDAQHWKRASSISCECIAMMYDTTLIYRNEPLKFKVEMVLEVIPKILNTLVVGVMGGDVFASVAALEGYMAFSHLLMSFSNDFPELQTLIESRIESFITSEQGRNKRVCPSLGDLITMMVISDKYSWNDFVRPYLEEMFDRNAKWLLASHPKLADVTNDLSGNNPVSKKRLVATFNTCKTSIRLVCFHKAFLSIIRPNSNMTSDKCRRRLNVSMGRPTPLQERVLQKNCKRILAITIWEEMFEFLALETPSDAYLSQWLRRAVVNSGRRGYHRQDALLRENRNNQARRNRNNVIRRDQQQQAINLEAEYAGDYESLADAWD